MYDKSGFWKEMAEEAVEALKKIGSELERHNDRERQKTL